LFNPANGEIIAELETADRQQVLAALEAAHQAAQGAWQEISLSRRKELLLKISEGILERAEELAKLESLNTGKPIKETTFMDIPSAAKTFAYFAHNLERYLAEEDMTITSEIAQARARLLRQPYGVAVLIVPWNYPLLIASWKLAQALGTGNCAILKPSSLTPLTAMELVKIAHAAGLPEGVMNLLHGSGRELGETLCTDKRVDLISFTGSNQVGKEIIHYASRNVKKLIIELGGKSASIILKDADLEAAVNGSLCSIFLNQGQMCTAMSRILVEDAVYERFLDDFTAKAQRIKLGDGLDYQTQMGPLISAEQRKKVIASVEQAKKEGAELLCGGKIPESPELKKGFFFEPTVLAEVTPEMAIFQEEVFGPIACVTKFSGMEEAVGLANKSDFGLANCVWSKDASRAAALAAKINAGTTWVNTYGMFYNELPYGGFKQSGFGKELGREGFLEYTRLKNVIVDQTKDTKPLINYWYGF
jgi:betaine-aldehyde dehydrogenase